MDAVKTLEHKRQSALTLDGIKLNHLERYKFAISYMNNHIVLNKTTPKFIFDAGCGCGYGSYLMAHAGFCVSAYDSEEQAIYIAEKHYSHGNIKYHLRDVFDFSLHAEVTVAFEIIEHLKDDVAFLEFVNKKSEYLIGSVPNEKVTPFDAKKHRWHYRHYTRSQLKALLDKTGWKIEFFGGQLSKRDSDATVVDIDRESATIVFVARKK